MITKVINVNLHQPIYERLTAKQGDIASRYLLFHLLDGDKPFDLSNRTVRVYAIKPDKTEIFNDLTINDASKGYCTLELTSQCLASAGVVKMELYISESGKVLTSIPFKLEVIACVNTANSITSTNEFSALEAALSSLQDYDNLRREIVQAKKGYGTVGERLDGFDTRLDTKTNIDQVKEEITKAQLGGASVDTSNFILNSNLLNFDEGILDINTPATIWEKGFIDSSGALVDDSTHYRTKDFIYFDTSKDYTTYMTNGNGCVFRFYNDDNTFSQSVSVTATTSESTRTFTPPTSKAKIVLNWYSSSYPISTDNFKLTTITNLSTSMSLLSSTIDNILNNNVMCKETSSVDFDDYTNGSYWISVSKTTSQTTPLLNAPDGITWGNFSVVSFKILNNYYLQLAVTSTNNLGRYGAYIRLFTKGTNVIRWSDLDVRFFKSEDNYVAFGDSITHGYLKTENGQNVISDYQYWKTVGNILKLNASEGANTGSGFVFVQGNKNALRIIEEYDFTNVNLATFAFGTNDWNGNIPLGTINDIAINGNVNTNGTYTNTTNTIYSAIKYCVEKALSQNPKMTLILITPINRSQVGNSGATLTKETNWGYGATNKAGYTLSDVCQAIVDVAKYYGIRYIDNREGCPINRLNVNSLTTDGLHPDDWGYIKLGQYYTGQIGAIYRPNQR